MTRDKMEADIAVAMAGRVAEGLIFGRSDLDKITQFIMDGWAIVKLMPHGNYFIGVMEKMNYDNNINDQEKIVYISPRKKDHFYLVVSIFLFIIP